MHIIGVPVQICDGPVVLASVQHGQIDELADRERPPNSQVVVHVDLPDRHPLEVGTDGVHLALVYCDAHTVFDEGIFCVVQLSLKSISISSNPCQRVTDHAIAVCVVCYFVIIPHWNPRKLLVTLYEVQVGTVCGQALAVVVQSEDLAVW